MHYKEVSQCYKIVSLYIIRKFDKQEKKRSDVSDQPRVAAVPVRRVLERDEGEGAPLVDWDD